MDKLDRINELYLKGHINEAEYEALYERHKPQKSWAEELIGALGNMSLESLLELYKDAEIQHGKAGASLLHLLIVAELDKRING